MNSLSSNGKIFINTIKSEPKKRTTKPSLIASHETADDVFGMFDSFNIVMFGQKLDGVALWVSRLYFSSRMPNLFNPSKIKRRAAEKHYAHIQKIVCDIFIDAMLRHDRETIIQLADAAAFFKGRIDNLTGGVNPARVDDPLRFRLLTVKHEMLTRGHRLTLAEIAKNVLVNPAAFSAAKEDKFSALRRLCKKLRVPIKPDSRQRKTGKK